MPLIKKSLRQELVVAVVEFGFADLLGLSGAYQAAIDIPPKAMVLKAMLCMDTAFNSATSDTFSIGDKVGTAAANSVTFSTAAAIAAGAAQIGQGTGKKVGAPSSVGITWTGVGAAPTAGAGRLIVEYIVDGRGQFSQG